MKQLKTISPIGNEDVNAVPVQQISLAIRFYTQTLGFLVVTEVERSAVLKRDDVQIGLVAQAVRQLILNATSRPEDEAEFISGSG